MIAEMSFEQRSGLPCIGAERADLVVAGCGSSFSVSHKLARVLLVAATTEGFGQGGEKDAQVSEKVRSIFRAAGLKVATQNYEYTSAGNVHRGQNTYAIINAPRGDATEAIVLVAAWKTVEDELNINGITLALTLARYFRRMFLPFFFFSLFGTSWWVELLMVDRLVSVVEGYYIPDHA